VKAAFRAGASIAMLLGFYVLALVQLGLVVLLAVWLVTETTTSLGLKIVLPLFFAVGATLVGLWKAMRFRPSPPVGVQVRPEHAPELWQQINALAAEAGTRAPDELRLEPGVNAAVSEDAKWLGLVPGTRRMYIGLPLLQAFSVDQLRSVLAHELGHYSGRHTRLGAIAYRGRLAILHTVSRIGRFNPVGWVFRGYLRLYLLVDNAASRRQELEADQASVRVAGPEVAASALRELPILDQAWDFYFDRYVGHGWSAGYAPDDLFGGFGRLVAARTDEIARMRADAPEHEGPVRWDTHPPIPVRIAAMAAAPRAEHPVDGRPAAVLLPNLDRWGKLMQAEHVEIGDRTVLPWDEFTASSIVAGQQRLADRVFRSLARLTGQPSPGLAELLDVVAAGRLADLAREFFPDVPPAELPAATAGLLNQIIELAAVRSGVARWQHSWSGPATLVDADGAPVELSKLAELAVDPATVAEARQRLAAAGVDVTQTTMVEARATATGAQVIGGMANIQVDGAETDVILLNRGFVLVPAPKDTDGGDDRLERIVSSVAPADLAKQHRFLPYEEVASAVITKRVPVRVELTLHDGGTVTMKERWSSGGLGKEARSTFTEVLEELAER
jgi:Zn-dependent protease with chaperone function